MTNEQATNHAESVNCWQTVGAFGDGSCDQLETLSHCRECPVYIAVGRPSPDREGQEDDLAGWSARLADKPMPEETKALSLMVFRVKSAWFALKTGLFDEVAEMTSGHSIPGKTDGCFRGIFSISGELRLFFSLADIMGITDPIETPAQDKAIPRLAVIGRGKDRFAFPVEEMLGVFSIAEQNGEALPPPPDCRQHLSRRVVSIEGRTVEVLDEDRLFDAMTRSLVS